MNEWVTAMQARKWMKKNESFLPSWHAYVGSELGLFDEFRTARTVEAISEKTGYPYDLLASWVNVGVAVKHMKKRPNNRFRTSKRKCASLMGDDQSPGVKALLKEMMELHLPTLLKYPDIMKSHERAEFNHERHGEVVAETSALLEHFAIKKIKRMIKDKKVTSVVDLGCGHGGYLRKLAMEYPHLEMIGVDINQKVIEKARTLSEGYPNITFEVGDINEWKPREEENVDVVLLHNIFHYIHPEDRRRLLNHLHTYVSNQGLISVITPINETEHGEAFSSAFNSFFVAHSNLFALPNKGELKEITQSCEYELFDLDPIIKEGSWYTFWLSPTSPVREMKHTQMAGSSEQTLSTNSSSTNELTRSS
ncbi:methyltransferase domain-containing protein [Halobacillus sp. HZG1]|uniref:class I SAM-dependent methyltransferase n=1 Tax=Halobacillus sp. HZG1 TaxID=3111769 RepID=UPI002DB73B35|nr:methyltransferase domain-containing protein [Halobacillus sp. HZG1]MEC3884174.1 methyltransferase domain-containing protein [Halobacillus sp. HZG1]